MIAIHLIEGRYCPLLTCDACHRRITNAALANVVFDMNARPSSTPRFAHKGVCHDSIDNDIRKAGGFPGWEECRHWFVNLLHNTALHGTALDEAVKRAHEWSEFGL